MAAHATLNLWSQLIIEMSRCSSAHSSTDKFRARCWALFYCLLLLNDGLVWSHYWAADCSSYQPVIASILSSSSSASLFQRPFVWSLISSSPTFQFYSNVAPPRDKTLSHCHCCCCNESTVHNNWTVMGLRATFESDKKPSSSSNQTFPLPFALFFLRSCSASWIRDPMIRHDLKLSAERTCTERSA